MSKVIAAIDNSLAAQPTISSALALGRLFDAEVELLHVMTDGQRNVRSAAEAAGLPLRTTPGPVAERLVEVGQARDVAALVIGARGTPAGSRPLGSTALTTATSLAKPVVVVPPDARPPAAFKRVLLPVEGDPSAAFPPRAIVELTRGAEIDVVVLHVHAEDSLPAFTDQPQHEQQAWAREFLRRYCPWGIGSVRLETRVGRVDELVLRAAEETRAELIILDWAQELAAGRAPVVRAVLGRGRTPVMLVPVAVPAEARDGDGAPAALLPVG